MNKRLLPVVVVPSCILMIPLLAMVFKAEGWAWSLADFVVMWMLIAGVILTYKLIARRATTRAYRIAAGLGLATGLVLIWINGAVGIIGSEDNPANLLYAGVLAVGAIGAALARLQPLGMSRALFATAIAQFLVPVIALIVWRPDFSPGVVKVFALNAGFVMLFSFSALLFRHAAQPADGRGEKATA